VSGESIRWRFEMAMRDDDSLSPNAKFVGLILKTRMKSDGRCDPGIARIATDTGLSENTVRDAIAELEGKVRRRPDRKSGRPQYAHLRKHVGGGRRRGGEGATNLYEATPWNPAPSAPFESGAVANPARGEPFKNPARGAPEDVTKTESALGLKETSRAHVHAREAEDPPEVEEEFNRCWAESGSAELFPATRPARGAYSGGPHS
jgi:hypothetical protein